MVSRWSPANSVNIELQGCWALIHGTFPNWVDIARYARSQTESMLKFFVNHRKLHAATAHDLYLIWRMNVHIGSLEDMNTFAKLNVNKNDWKVENAKQNREKLSFESDFGLYHFVHIPPYIESCKECISTCSRLQPPSLTSRRFNPNWFWTLWISSLYC